MPYRITQYEQTPNPNALKCHLDQPISEQPRSFRSREEAAGDLLAKQLFQAGVTNVLMSGEWMTINKPEDADWKTIKRDVEEVLSRQEVDVSQAAAGRDVEDKRM